MVAGLAAVLTAAVGTAAPSSSDNPTDTIYSEWNVLEARIRDGSLNKEAAKENLLGLYHRLKEVSPGSGSSKEHYFPVKGGRPWDIGGEKGSGFARPGFDFYDGTGHHAHPAHDIFVKDDDFDSLRDDTGKPVEVLSFSNGIVVSLNKEWVPSSDIRGGLYVWVFDPAAERFYAYAHLGKIAVTLGQPVSAGDTLGTVGRTGKSAYRKRSPTHLHFLCLDFSGGRMAPVDTYREMLTAVFTPP